jgi:dienelactone hydrolase
MNRKTSLGRFLSPLRKSLAACCLVAGCATRTPDNTHFSEPGRTVGFYQGFTNCAASPLPKPTGLFAVGRVDRLFTDSSRDILYRSVTNGSLMTTIWYPAGEISRRVPGSYVNQREMQAWIELFGKYGCHWDAAQVARLTNSYSYSFRAAPLSSHPRKFPVVLYCHGQVGLRTDNTGSAEELASHGFIVVSSAHGGTAGMELPDGTLVEPKLEFHLSGNDTNSIALAVFQDETRDLQFVMDELERLNSKDPVFAGRFDLNHIGVFGWSYGGASAADLCNVDHRCKAGVALDPGGYPDLSKIHFKQPFLILAGPHGVSAGARQLFEQLNKDAWFVKIRDAGHDEFGDSAEFFRPSKTGRNQALIRTYLVSFFTRYLKSEDGHDLDTPLPNHPEIEAFLKK